MSEQAPAVRLVRDLSALQGLPQTVIEDQGHRSPDSPSEDPSQAHVFSTGSAWHGWCCNGGPGCAGARATGYATQQLARAAYDRHVRTTHATPQTGTSAVETLRAVVAEITDEANARNVIAEATRELTGRVVVWPTQATTPRRFVLRRHRDVSGISGEGQVADGVLWPDGTASIRWRGEHPSIVFWDRGRTSVEFIHGHQGATEIELLDTEDGCPDTVRTPPDTTPTCTDTSSAGLRRKPSDTDLTDPDTLRREYADAIRAHSWASAPTRVDAITDSVMAVHDRALDALRTKLARQNLRVAELEAANHLLQQANRVRPYTDERRPPLPRRQRHAQ